MASLCVFCGSQPGVHPSFLKTARELGVTLANDGHTLVYGGGSVGLMGELADSMLQNGGTVIGVIPKALASVELMHRNVSDMRIVPDMHIRKATMHDLADGYVALPGGFGTMEELFEALCWAQLDFHNAPVALLNIEGIYDGLIQLLEGMTQQGFLSRVHKELLFSTTTIEELRQWLQDTF